ncbi:ECF-type sigma factor [Planctomicrobium sp.]|jgi:DNA-directed RNA polymerase specialized sigma24 family protein|nr:ECF-type sigma factor [Planctomicrobium sp.]MDB4732825.1 ECF-type sigma factor [Planctomicrobium sp.]
MATDEQMTEPVTQWIDGLQQGDESATRKIWEHFVKQLCVAMREKLHPETRRVYDEEDAAISAFRSFCNGVEQGRFPDLNDRHSLWRLLLVIASRKVTHRHRYEQQQRRDVRKNLEASLFSPTDESGAAGLAQFTSREPTPELQAEFMETSSELFNSLNNTELKEIAQLKIEGFTDGEIAAQLNLSRQAVQRKMERIRRVAQRILDSEET